MPAPTAWPSMCSAGAGGQRSCCCGWSPCGRRRGSAACRKQAVGGGSATGSRNRRAGESAGTRRGLGSAGLLSHRRSVAGEVVLPCGLGHGHGHKEQKQAVGGGSAKGSSSRRAWQSAGTGRGLESALDARQVAGWSPGRSSQVRVYIYTCAFMPIYTYRATGVGVVGCVLGMGSGY